MGGRTPLGLGLGEAKAGPCARSRAWVVDWRLHQSSPQHFSASQSLTRGQEKNICITKDDVATKPRLTTPRRRKKYLLRAAFAKGELCLSGEGSRLPPREPACV